MKQLRQIWRRLSKREKNLAAATVVILLVVLGRYFLLSPYLERREWVKSQLEIQPQLLDKNLRYLDRKSEIMANLEKSRADLKAMEPALLSGNSPSMVASDLQLTVQGLAGKDGAQLITTRVLNPEPMGSFIRFPIQIDVSAQIEQMANMLKRIESAERLLLISDLNIHAIISQTAPQRQPDGFIVPGNTTSQLRATMVVSGFARNPAAAASKGKPGAAKSESGEGAGGEESD